MFTRILIAYDGSPHSERALDCALDLAHKYEAELVLVNAFHPISKQWGAPFMEQAEGRAIGVAENVMVQAESKLRDVTLPVVAEVLEGPPADAILRVAKIRECDLIVIGSRGWGEFRAMLLGSVSERVAHHSPVPVLIVK